MTGQVDTLLEIAEGFKRQDIAFLFIGEGAKKRWLERRVTELGLANVIILPWQPAKELAYSLSSASLAVVGIDQKASRLAMPSKLLSYLSVGAPVLCLADVETDLAKFVSKYKVGYTFSPSQKNETTKLIEWLMDNPDECRQLSRNALVASGEFTCANAMKFL
jgi:glycosyltransferase involved in cell wall biosynthesis